MGVRRPFWRQLEVIKGPGLRRDSESEEKGSYLRRKHKEE
jgi:hypothetical protein